VVFLLANKNKIEVSGFNLSATTRHIQVHFFGFEIVQI